LFYQSFLLVYLNQNNTIANELNISPRTLVNLVDQYGAKVAPLAEKWKEWKDSQDEQIETPVEVKKEGK
jgi:hypothetical protein